MTPNVRELITAGFHFGHRTSRWNPKMKPYIFKRRNLIHIIDLRATLRGLITARELARVIGEKGLKVLFLGTKRQAKDLVARESARCRMPHVAERWPGGLLTNFGTIRQQLHRLEELESMQQTGEIQLHSKKMISSLRREERRILRNLGGVRDMEKLPGLLVVVDPAREKIAVREAHKLGIPVVALADTDADPDRIDVIVPGNDDSLGAIEIFLVTLSEAVVQATTRRMGPSVPKETPAEPVPAAKAAETAAAEAEEAPVDTGPAASAAPPEQAAQEAVQEPVEPAAEVE